MIWIKFRKIVPEAVIPTKASDGAAGFDVVYPEGKPAFSLLPGETQLVKLGFAIAIPKGYEVQVRPRSGLALKENITVANSPGTIDSDYRGEVGVILRNLGTTWKGDSSFTVEPGMRIAQLVVAEVPEAKFLEVEALDDTERGEGGFGSTGVDVS